MKIISPYGHCEYAFEHDKFGYYIHIYNLFIYKKHRGKGKARELLQKTINEITASGWTEEIQIVADPNDPTVNKERLIKFYKSMNLEVYECYIKP